MNKLPSIKNRLILALLSLTVAAAFSDVRAAPGDLDAGFNAGAITRAGTPTNVRAVQPLPDGKILIGGDFDSVGGTTRTLIARLNADGSLDAAFAAPLQTFDVGSSGTVRSIVLQPDGKILLGGAFQIGADVKVIARLNANGSLDASFDSDGGGSFAQTIVLQTDGKIIVGGQMGNFGGVQSRGLVRLNPNGTLETALGLAADLQNNIYAVALARDGKILVGGNTFVGGTTPLQNHLARLNASGTLDASFAVGSGANNTVNSIAVQPNGKILVGGLFTSISGTARTAVARLNENGSLDASFSANIVGDNNVQKVLLQPNGKILIAGGLGLVNGVGRSGVARLNADGSTDAFYPTPSGPNNLVFAVARQPHAKVLIGGTFTMVAGATRRHLARLLDAPTPTPFDFDGDGCADLGVFRASNRNWYFLKSSNGAFYGLQWGLATDRLAPADYDGDGKWDVAVWREAPATQAAFYILNSSTSTVRVEVFGQTGDDPAPADFDGDGRADPAVYRAAAQSTFFYRGSLNNPGGDIAYLPWGTSGDVPVAGDYDGDGRTDAAVFRPSNSVWYVRLSSSGALQATAFGLNTDTLAPADYDGDGKTDRAVFRGGTWFVSSSAAAAVEVVNWGLGSDKPAPADYDGDGRTDFAVYRGGAWWIRLSAFDATDFRLFGLGGDAPLAAAFIH